MTTELIKTFSNLVFNLNATPNERTWNTISPKTTIGPVLQILIANKM